LILNLVRPTGPYQVLQIFVRTVGSPNDVAHKNEFTA
jgi:hypothetical protein